MSDTNALTVRENAVANTTMTMADVLMREDVWNRANEMGKALMKTSYLGNKTSEFGATMAVITMAKENMDPVQFSRAYNMIQDKPEMKPNYALGLFKAHGGRYKFNRADEDVCDMEFTAPDGTFAHIVVRMDKMLETNVPWTNDKQGNRILKSNWSDHPDDMLFARCTGKALRRVWPEFMGGVHLSGEIEHDETAPKARKVISVDDVKSRIVSASAKAEETATVDVPEAAQVENPREDVVDAEIVDDVATPTVKVGVSPVDFTRCPIEGPFFNVPFDEMEPDTLSFLMDESLPQRHPELTPEHIACVKAAMKKYMED